MARVSVGILDSVSFWAQVGAPKKMWAGVPAAGRIGWLLRRAGARRAAVAVRRGRAKIRKLPALVKARRSIKAGGPVTGE